MVSNIRTMVNTTKFMKMLPFELKQVHLTSTELRVVSPRTRSWRVFQCRKARRIQKAWKRYELSDMMSLIAS